ncbi:MAG: cytochrome c-type biogenesis protein CcmH [Microthrixaceae bacterium]|nr:cytochrome c-type biogenesis protein CcmH [Microthrixaceae bacterium]HMT62802.1 cytochrome c-type biogenesis protein CcmH [Microthrixaceae bacterium]
MKAPIRRGPVWVAMAVAVVAMLWIGARPRPTDGVSDDRLYAIASQLKCLQCAGESVAGSQSSIAIKMREEIRREMRAGRSDDEILDRFVASYPTEVLLNPPRSGLTLLVWVAPVVVVAVGAVGVASSMAAARRARRAAAAHSVTDEERELVDAARRSEARPPADARPDGSIGGEGG